MVKKEELQPAKVEKRMKKGKKVVNQKSTKHGKISKKV